MALGLNLYLTSYGIAGPRLFRRDHRLTLGDRLMEPGLEPGVLERVSDVVDTVS